MESFRNPVYDPIRVIMLILIILVSGFFIFKFGFNRNFGNQAQVLDIGGIIDDGAVLPSLLSSGIDTSFASFYDTANQDFYNALSDTGLNMLRFLPGVNANYAHWDGWGLGLTVAENAVWNNYPGGTKDAEVGYTSTYNNVAKFHNKFMDAVLHLPTRHVATYSLNILTQTPDGTDPTANPAPVPTDYIAGDHTTSVQKAIDENINLLNDIKNNYPGITLESVQLCAECNLNSTPSSSFGTPAFDTPGRFVERVLPIAQAIQTAFPNVKIQLHVKKFGKNSSDYGVNSKWNRCIIGDPKSDEPACIDGFNSITNLEFGTYLNGDDLADYDTNCAPDHYSGDPFNCFRDRSRTFLDGDISNAQNTMQNALDTYTNFFGLNRGFRITQWEINNYDQSNLNQGTFTTAIYNGSIANAAFNVEYLFKLAKYNDTHNQIIKSASVTNFGGYPSHVVGDVNKNPAGNKDTKIPANETYNTTGTYSQQPLKLYITGLTFKLIKNVFDGHHRVFHTTFDMSRTTSTNGQLQGYAFQSTQNNAISYFFVNWSNQDVPLSSISVDGKAIDDPLATPSVSWIKGPALSSTYGLGDSRNADPTMITDNLFVSPDSYTGTDAVVIPKFSIVRIDGLDPSTFGTHSTATFTVTKVVVNNDGGTKQVSDFPLTVSGTSVTSGVSAQFNPGTYTVSESFDENYVGTFSGDCDSGGTITLSAGDNKVCTITNNDIAQNVTTTSGSTTDGSTNATTTSTTSNDTTTTSTTDGTSGDTTSTTNDGTTTTTTTTSNDTTTTATTSSDLTTSSSGGSGAGTPTSTTVSTSTTDGGTTSGGSTTGGTGEVPPPPLPNGGICTPYLTTYIQYGAVNNSDDVTRLQNFLNSHEGESLTVTGTYDDPTFEAVKRFQSKYASSVLTVWGLSTPTGYVYKTTRNKINSFNCNTTIICPEFVGDFVPGETDPEISKIKSLLNDLGFASGSGDYYDDLMKTAVIDFQETFHKVILDPWGLVNGTAWIHNTTRKYLNDLVGCPTGPADLDGKGTFEY